MRRLATYRSRVPVNICLSVDAGLLKILRGPEIEELVAFAQAAALIEQMRVLSEASDYIPASPYSKLLKTRQSR